MRFIGAPQEHEDKICSTYIKETENHLVIASCVVGQRSAMHQTSEMVTSLLFEVSQRPTRE